MIFSKKFSIFSSFDGTNFEETTSSTYPHKEARLATYEGRPFTMGGEGNSKTEIMNMESGKYEWEEGPDFPPFTDWEGRTHGDRQ